MSTQCFLIVAIHCHQFYFEVTKTNQNLMLTVDHQK